MFAVETSPGPAFTPQLQRWGLLRWEPVSLTYIESVIRGLPVCFAT